MAFDVSSETEETRLPGDTEAWRDGSHDQRSSSNRPSPQAERHPSEEDVILNWLLWLPGLLAARLLRPVREMVDTMAENADAAIAEYTKDHGLEL